jgi:hypothetical protein
MNKGAVVAVIGVAVLASGCGSVKADLTPETVIDPTEGIVVARSTCGSGVYKTEWYPSGVRSKGYFGALNFAFVLGCNNGLQAYAVKQGTYFMGKAVGMSFLDYAEDDAWSITVTAGRMTYVGHFMVPTETRGNTTAVAPAFVVDRSAEARQELKARYPWMLERYEFATALAQRPGKSASTERSPPP